MDCITLRPTGLFSLGLPRTQNPGTRAFGGHLLGPGTCLGPGHLDRPRQRLNWPSGRGLLATATATATATSRTKGTPTALATAAAGASAAAPTTGSLSRLTASTTASAAASTVAPAPTAAATGLPTGATSTGTQMPALLLDAVDPVDNVPAFLAGSPGRRSMQTQRVRETGRPAIGAEAWAYRVT